MISSFRGEYRFLSNFYPSPITVLGDTPFQEDITYPTVEHAYQAAKTLDAKLRKKIAALPSPVQAKAAGQRNKLKLRPDWEKVKLKIMLGLLRQKFQKGSVLAERLLATGDEELVEGNWWKDCYWGQCPVGTGENHLGRLLMKVRKELRGIEE